MQDRLLIDFIKNVRNIRSKFQFYKDSIVVSSYSIIILILFGWLEFIFYFTGETRFRIAVILSASCFILLAFLIIKWIIQSQGLFGNNSLDDTAKWIGNKRPEISDRLLNCLQLESKLKLTPNNSDLIKKAVDSTIIQTEELKLAKLITPINIKIKLFFLGSVLLMIFAINYFSEKNGNAFIRLFNPSINYPIPMPFLLHSLSGDQDVLSGDTVITVLKGSGQFPDSIDFVFKNEKSIQRKTVQKINDTFSYNINKISSDIIIWGEVKSTSFFSSWEKITSKPDTISVIDRPRIDNINFTIIPPTYTDDLYSNHKGNVTNIRILQGSRLKINAESSKPIIESWMKLGNKIKLLNTNDMKIRGDFIVYNSDTLTLHCKDENNIINIDPTHYFVSVYKDRAPEIAVFDPNDETILDEKMIIPFSLQINDDYGISALDIEYNIIHPSYLSVDSTIYYQSITNFNTKNISQNILYNWTLQNLGLMPEDKLSFRIRVMDNNNITGPTITYTKEFLALYPSLEDLFMNVEEKENQVAEEAENLTFTIDEVQELLEDLELDLLKSDEMNWEQSQKAEESLQKIDDIFKQIENMSESLEKIQEQLDKNNLVNEELGEKFSDLRELLDQIMTPEMKEAIQKMQEAMQEMDPEKMLEAMENMDFNIEEMEQQLDRFIDMFQMALAEQKMDEIQKQLEQMLKEQADILQDLNKEGSKAEDLAAKEKRQEEELNNLDDLMKEAEKMIQDLSSKTSESIDELRNSETMKNTDQNLKSAQQQFAKGQKEEGGKNAESANKNMEELQNKFAQIQQEFQEQMVGEMTKEFQRVVHNMLTISQSQEKLQKNAKLLKSSSPNLTDTAVEQNNIRRQMTKLMQQLHELSTKTFYITPDIGKMIGRSIISMDKSIAMLEQKQVGSARGEQKKAIEGINDAAYVLLDAMEQMASSGSASGLEAFMMQMEQLSKQQQGINQGTMQMGQMSMMAQQGMMQKLGQQQSMLQQALQDLLSENPGQKEGGAAKASQEMEEVIKDFKNRKVNQRTIERQERILSRMLDSHRSLSQRDYSKKRKSETGEQFLYIGPDGLPYDMGERKLLLMEAMEIALKEGYSQEYKKMLKNYFKNLQDQLIKEND